MLVLRSRTPSRRVIVLIFGLSYGRGSLSRLTVLST